MVTSLNTSQRMALCGILAIVAAVIASAAGGPLTGLAGGAVALYFAFRIVLTERDRELLRVASDIGNVTGRLL